MLTVSRRLGMSRRLMIALFALNLISIVFEAIGIGMLLPIIELLRNDGAVNVAELKGAHWDFLRELSSKTGIPITLGLLLALSFGFICLRQLFSYFNIVFYGMTQYRLAHQIRQRAFGSFLRSETALHDKARVGEIASSLTVEIDRALSSVFAIVRTFGTAVQLLIYMGGLFILSPALTVISVAVIGVVAFLIRGLLARVRRTGAAITDANLDLTGFLVERLKHARLIRLSGTQRAEVVAFGKLSARHCDQNVQQKLVTAKLSLLPEPFAIGFSYLVLFIGGYVFGLSIASLGLFVVIMIRLTPVVREVISDYNTVFGKWPAAERLDRQLRQFAEAREPKGGDRVFAQLENNIRFDDVSFSYASNDTPTLHAVDVVIPAHKMTALVGPSGAGKSTFVDLLPRLRDPTTGCIRFDDIPTEEFSTASVRANIAFVPQQPQIFNITAGEHIRYGKDDATDDEVREAARISGALRFIESLPDGFNTRLEDGGLRLSGGQRQRLDIARALVRRAPILILDEPTSALDADAEASFRDSLQTLRRETYLTIIVIAHRLSTIADADQIIVLNKGEVEAVGSHAELVGGENWYARAFRKQFAVHSSRSVNVPTNFAERKALS